MIPTPKSIHKTRLNKNNEGNFTPVNSNFFVNKFKENSGYAQQYLFYYKRELK
jgi:hypothetical protein